MSDLLMLLAEEKSFSRQKLTALLGLNDKQLAQQIEELQQRGIQLDTENGQVRLIPQLQRLNNDYLSRELAPYHVQVKTVIDSTNQYLLENITRLNKGDLCLAEHQLAGRGRRGRQWLSPFAGQVILSFYWTFDAKKSIEGLSLAVGMAIADTLRKAGAWVYLKWPNDILLDERKLAGILIEMANTQNGLLNLVVGIGINLSLPKQENHIDQPWAELIEVLPELDRNQLIVQLVKNIYAYLEQFEQEGVSVEFRQKWVELDHLFGEEVNVITEKQVISGIEQGIDEQGYLQLVTNNGTEWLKFNGGEVSLRKKQ